MKIVIISRVSHPLKAPRAHRATELAKELVIQGHDVTLYALLGNYDYTEYAAHTGIKFKNLGKARFGLISNTGKRTSLDNLFTRIGQPILFPDCLMIPMVKKAIKNEGKIDLLITIASPHVIHYAASRADLSQVNRWIADCGDPFMGNPFKKYPSYFENFERAWCKKCDAITVPFEGAKDAYYPEYREKMHVVPQGFNFNEVQLADYTPNTIPTFAYSGVFYSGFRDPSKFLDFLATYNEPFKFIVYTKTIGILSPYKDILGDKLDVRSYVPREALLYELSKMDFLINIPNKSSVQQPSKLIDYAMTKRPILEITSDFQDEEMVRFEEFLHSDYKEQIAIKNVEDYDITNVAHKFLCI